MTPLVLIDSLAKSIEDAVKNFKFIAQYQPAKKVSVYVQGVPEEDFNDDSFYPLIVVELLSVEDTTEGSIAGVLLTVGTYRGEIQDAWRDHLNLIEQLRQFLVTNIIDNKFIPQLPIYTGLVEPRSDNFMFSNIFLTYQVAAPMKSFADDYFFGGN